jgi:tagatose-6-phosphate ketose/aldose isomerase
VPTLLISLGRSGGSPESMATVDLAEQLVRDVHHLVITCNPAGELVRKCEGARNAFVLVLPDSAHDRGFAVTASFSSMLLSVALIFNLLASARVPAIEQAAAQALTTTAPLARKLAARGFKRVVYLGSNELGTLASEAALKLLELADGKVIALGYSSLQFRHGPKCVIDGDTLVIMLLANHEHARAYDRDLLVELRRNARAGEIVALGSRVDDLPAGDDIAYAGAAQLSVFELVFVHAVFAQAHGLAHSLALDLTPDKPNALGLVNRVVQGVTIHPWKNS